METPYSPLFEPVTIGAVTLRNRFAMSPMTREFSPGGIPGPDVAAYYRRRAAGDVGLIITEATGIETPVAVDNPRIPVLYGERALAGWSHVVDEVHHEGAAIIPQLWHQGVMRMRWLSTNPEAASVGPSGYWGTPGKMSLPPEDVQRLVDASVAMTQADIDEVIAAYAQAARDAIAVGFDGVAIHGAHGYLPDVFLWSDTNRRTDRYGGNRRDRARFAAEVVGAIRDAIGPDRPIVFRFSQWKQQDYLAKLAETPQELEEVLGPLADAGVDVFDASVRYFNTPAFPGSPLSLAGWAKKVTGKRSMLVGGIGLSTGTDGKGDSAGSSASSNLDLVMERFGRGEFDIVALGRSVLSAADWVGRLRRGEPLPAFDPSTREYLS